MEVCRICGIEKSAEKLKNSLLDQIEKDGFIVNYREFFEYICQVSIDSSLDLPQKFCCSCKFKIENFAEFSSLVEQYQLKLQNKFQTKEHEDQRILKETKDDKLDLELDAPKEAKEEARGEPPSEKETEEEPDVKLNSTEDNLLEELVDAEPKIVEDGKRTTLRKRRMSVYSDAMSLLVKKVSSC